MTPYEREYRQEPEGGSAMVEFVIVFPMWVLMTLGIMQLALMHAASNVVNVSAFASARSATVYQDTDLYDIEPTKPAVIASLPITGVTSIGNLIQYPVISKPSGLDGIAKYVLELTARQVEFSLVPKTKVEFFEDVDEDGKPTEDDKKPEDLKDKIGARAKHHFELVMPMVNQVFVVMLGTGGIKAYTIGGKDSLMTEDFMQVLDANLNATALTLLYGNVPHTPINENAMIFAPWKDSDEYKEERDDSGGG